MRAATDGKVNPFALELLERNESRPRAAQQGMGRIRDAGRTEDGHDHHRLRPGRRRDVSRVAGPADHRALGRRRSGGGRGYDETKRAAFMKAFSVLQKRIALFTNLRLEALDRMALLWTGSAASDRALRNRVAASEVAMTPISRAM